jgi:hypothetical protein
VHEGIPCAAHSSADPDSRTSNSSLTLRPVRCYGFTFSGGVAQSVRACGSYPQCPGFKSLHRHQPTRRYSCMKVPLSPRKNCMQKVYAKSPTRSTFSARMGRDDQRSLQSRRMAARRRLWSKWGDIYVCFGTIQCVGTREDSCSLAMPTCSHGRHSRNLSQNSPLIGSSEA